MAGVIGDPVRHSLSPALHNAAYAALGLDWVYVAFEVPAGGAAAAVAAVPALGLGGLNVTMPHKADAAAACDRLTERADALGAVNTVVPRPGGGLLGDSTDGPGFLASLDDAGFDPAGKRCLVLGAGGAARAVVHALGSAGVTEVGVWARRPEAAAVAAGLALGNGRVVGLEAAEVSDLVVNATPIGMAGSNGVPVGPDRLGPGQLVVDLVYEPRRTALLEAAAARGAATLDGVGMLVHQAALAFLAFTGEAPPIDAMRAAVAVNSDP